MNAHANDADARFARLAADEWNAVLNAAIRSALASIPALVASSTTTAADRHTQLGNGETHFCSKLRRTT